MHVTVSDVLTVEIEHVDVTTLIEIEKEGLIEVQPSPATVQLIQVSGCCHNNNENSSMCSTFPSDCPTILFLSLHQSIAFWLYH